MMKRVALFLVISAMLMPVFGCGKKEPDTVTTASDSTSTASQKQKQEKQQIHKDTINQVKVPLSEAIEIYQKQYPESDITALELESDFGNYYYKIEGVSDQEEYSIRIDGTSKKVDKEKTERLDVEDRDGLKRKSERVDLEHLKELTAITQIAEKEAPGSAKEWNLERELDQTVWEVKVVDGKTETTVKINGQSGKVLEIEKDD